MPFGRFLWLLHWPLPHFSYAIFNDIDSVKALASDETAAIMLELVQGASGVQPADKDFVKALADFCKEMGIYLIVDEVQTGIGRTGKLYAYEHYDIVPLGSAYERIHLSTDNQGIFIRGNEVSLIIAHEQTENVTWKEARFDLQQTTPDGKIKTWCNGKVRLQHDITRRE